MKLGACADPSQAEWQRISEAHGSFAAQVPELGGSILGSEALQPTATARAVRGEQVTAGPFVETDRQLRGFYLVEAADLDRRSRSGSCARRHMAAWRSGRSRGGPRLVIPPVAARRERRGSGCW
jgi:hypothetical protein